MVAFDTPAEPLQLRRELEAKWVKRARRLLGKAVRKQKRSRDVKVALKEALRSNGQATAREIRAIVSEAVGFSLEEGERRIFFDRQLLKFTRCAPKRAPKRRPPVLALSGGKAMWSCLGLGWAGWGGQVCCN